MLEYLALNPKILNPETLTLNPGSIKGIFGPRVESLEFLLGTSKSRTAILKRLAANGFDRPTGEGLEL